MSDKTNLKRLVLTGVLIGLGTALSLIRIVQMPLGGEVTLMSMLPIALISIEYGIGWGLVGSFIFSLIQLAMQFGLIMTWGLSATALIGTIILDYILAYTCIGLSGMFRKKGVLGICLGVFLALFLRFACHVLSGTIIFDVWMPEEWSNPFLYSICYNGLFMLPETIVTMLGAVLVFKSSSFSRLMSSNMK